MRFGFWPLVQWYVYPWSSQSFPKERTAGVSSINKTVTFPGLLQLPPVSYHEDFNSTHMEARPKNVVARETQQSVSSPGHGSHVNRCSPWEHRQIGSTHTSSVVSQGLQIYASGSSTLKNNRKWAGTRERERAPQPGVEELASPSKPRADTGSKQNWKKSMWPTRKNRGTPTEAQNFVKEERPESARRSKERWVQHIKTFPSGTREQDKRGELKTHEHDTERPDTKDERGGMVTSMAFCMATQRNNNIDTTRVREANTSATENKEPNQQPRREPAELRAPRLPVLPRHPFPVPPPSSLEERSWLASQAW